VDNHIYLFSIVKFSNFKAIAKVQDLKFENLATCIFVYRVEKYRNLGESVYHWTNTWMMNKMLTCILLVSVIPLKVYDGRGRNCNAFIMSYGSLVVLFSSCYFQSHEKTSILCLWVNF
jgi:hypothetical protein